MRFRQRLFAFCNSRISGALTGCGAMVLSLVVPAFPALGQSEPDAGMLRYPDVSQDKIVFVYAGDLWTVPREGGLASPLASPPGEEMNPRFSPDGSKIAFVGNYEAGLDLYVCPTAGGIATRATFHPASEYLNDWTPDGRLLYSTNGFAGLGRMMQLVTISEQSPLPTLLPVPYGTNGTISPDGKWLAYTPYSRDSRTWKRYRGGMASDVWLFNLETKQSKQITDWEGTDSLPMWQDQTVYYLSDSGPEHRLNIWKYDTNTGARSQVTKHADYDVKWPSNGPGKDGGGEIVYQLAGSLMLLDLQTGESKKVEVKIPGDRPRLRPQVVDASKNIVSASISPKGKRVAVEARGDIWSAPVKNGVPQNLTKTSGVAERYPAWSPDGRWIAYMSDATGEYELVITQSDGRGETRRLTNNGEYWRYSPVWSPDSKLIAFTDKTGAIQLHDVEAKTTKRIDRDPMGESPDISWSRDSRYIAYAKPEEKHGSTAAIWVYDVERSEAKQLTSGYFNDSSPAFDKAGDFLYYQSNRRFSDPQYEDLGTTFIYRDTGVLLALPLRADVENPLLKKVDEVTWEEDKKEDEDKEEGDAEEEDKDAEKEADEADDETAEEPDPLTGSWTMTIDSVLIPAEARVVVLQLKLDADGSVSGSLQAPSGDTVQLDNPSFAPASGQFKATVQSPIGKAEISGTVSDNKMSGTVKLNAISLTANFSATRDSSGESDDENGTDKKKPADGPVVFEFEDAERRVIPLPVSPGNFRGLVVNHQNQLIFVRREANNPPAIKIFDINADSPSEQVILAGAGAYELSGDGKKLLVMRGSAISVTDAAAGKGAGDSINTDRMQVYVTPREEWKQVFIDAWRMQRDFFYDPTMHGVDWKAVRKRYEKMLEDATSRSDVGFIIGEMISELNVGHAYYRGISDDPDQPSGNTAVLACRLESAEGRYRIAEFYEGAAWDTDAQNPLRMAGAKVGQFILDVDGRELTADANPYAALQGLGGSLVRITLSDDAKHDEEDKRVDVQLPGGDDDLRFRHWIEKNRSHVDQKSDGKIGYIFVTNTGQPGQNDLVRQLYAQLDKQALIIDDRWNGGGQIPTRFIELLNRPATNYWARRDGLDWRWPPDSHQGPKCMLINGMSGSGGDMFPALFRQTKLGKLIGKRTWGGLVGITGGPSLIDGASVTVPSFAYYELDGTWGIEGHGVDPDIEVVDDPALMINGGDPQLDAAIEHLQQELELHPVESPKRPEYPNRKEMGLAPKDR